MKKKSVYIVLGVLGVVTLLAFQNCSQTNFKEVAESAVIPSADNNPPIGDPADPADPADPNNPAVSSTTSTTMPPPVTPDIPDITNVLPPNSKWKLVDMILNGNREPVPTINHILLNVTLQAESLRVAAEQQVGSSIKALYFIQFDQFCHPISGNYLGITSANSSELLGNPLDLQGGQFSTYTNNDDLNGPLCSSDSEATLRSEVSKEVNAMSKHISGSIHFERRGLDLVVTIGSDVFVFSPL